MTVDERVYENNMKSEESNYHIQIDYEVFIMDNIVPIIILSQY